jgi:hypothetical protein
MLAACFMGTPVQSVGCHRHAPIHSNSGAHKCCVDKSVPPIPVSLRCETPVSTALCPDLSSTNFDPIGVTFDVGYAVFVDSGPPLQTTPLRI